MQTPGRNGFADKGVFCVYFEDGVHFSQGGISTSWAPKSTYPLDGDIIRHTVRRKLGSNVLGVKIPNGKVSVKLFKFAVKLCSFLSFQRIYLTTRKQNMESTLHMIKRFERCSV